QEAPLVLTYLWIALGIALGGVARYACSSLIAHSIGDAFPWGTLLVNVVGSFVIGAFATLTGPDGRWLMAPDARLFVTVGVCGGYTTFSSFSIQTLNLIRAGEFGPAAANAGLSLGLCLISVWLGYVAGALINQAKGA
ncbi:MAG: fluoride efflux transporter CrcB, partial [Phenylobacterium sp.]